MAGKLSVALEAFDMKKDFSGSQTWGTTIRSVGKQERLQALERRVAGFCHGIEFRFTMDIGYRLSVQQLIGRM